MNLVTIADILSRENPVAIAALEHDCGMCHVPAGVWCKSLNPLYPSASVVHFERATRTMDKPRKKAA